MKTLHPKIKELQNRFKGILPTSRALDQTTLQVRAAFDTPVGSNETDAYVCLFGIPDSYGTVAIRGCFTKSIQERGPQSKSNEKIIHLWMHDRYEPLGQPIMMEEDAIGLKVRIKWDVEAGDMPKRIYTQTISGTVRQYSYGFDYVWDKMEYDEETNTIRMYEAALFETTSVSILASQPEASTIRTKEQLDGDIEQLSELTEDFITRLPFKYRMEMRQLMTRYKSLMDIKPDQLLDSLRKDEPVKGILNVGNYKLKV